MLLMNVARANSIREGLGLPLLDHDGSMFSIPQSIAIEEKSLPLENWPIWAKALANFAILDDKGIGDVVARIIGDENSAKFKAWHLATFGRACGCNGRQNLWNQKYPLNLKAT